MTSILAWKNTQYVLHSADMDEFSYNIIKLLLRTQPKYALWSF